MTFYKYNVLDKSNTECVYAHAVIQLCGCTVVGNVL
jgi:hypothetical protein